MEARRAASALLAGLALAVPGCGGDDEEEAPAGDRPTATAEGPATTATPTTEGDRTPDETATAETIDRSTLTAGEPPPPPEPAPEDRPGGAGDEIPIHTPALIAGEDGRLTPRLVRVPPFIAIRVLLRSADGAVYELAGGRRRLRAGEGSNFASATFSGLRPGRRIVLRGPQGRVVIEASAEPGP